MKLIIFDIVKRIHLSFSSIDSWDEHEIDFWNGEKNYRDKMLFVPGIYQRNYWNRQIREIKFWAKVSLFFTVNILRIPLEREFNAQWKRKRFNDQYRQMSPTSFGIWLDVIPFNVFFSFKCTPYLKEQELHVSFMKWSRLCSLWEMQLNQWLMGCATGLQNK